MIKNIDLNKCTGCGICDSVCPVDVLRLDTRREEIPPCQAACPAGVDMRGYIYLLKQGRLGDAIKQMRESLPLPAITGRVCFHPCESKCARNEVDEPVNINSLERYVADYWLKERARPVPRLHVARVAIVGSGPAGLSAAYYLTRSGYPVTLFESMPKAGGMLRYGIPEYRLPKTVLDAQINYIKDMGAEFQTSTAIGRDLSLNDLTDKGYKAVVLSVGAQSSKKTRIEGTELEGVLWGLEFLKDVNQKKRTKITGDVLVIGGGDVAMDAALTSLRLGARKVTLVCLETNQEMPAHAEYVQQAIDEGVNIRSSWGAKRLLGKDGKVSGAQLVCCTSVFDKELRFSPCFDESKTREIEADTVIFCIGQEPDLSLLPGEFKKTAAGNLAADTLLDTGVSGVFACGDVLTGTTSVVEAIASGRKAAVSIEHYLKGEPLKQDTPEIKKVEKPPGEGIMKVGRLPTPFIDAAQRRRNFKEVKPGYNEDAANAEAQRCMTCGSKAYIAYFENCMTCYNCEFGCPYESINVNPFRKVGPFCIPVAPRGGEKHG